MSYLKEMMICIQCDNCKETYKEYHNGITHWHSRSRAHEEATDDGWHETDDEKHYCPKCHEIDDDDNLVIKPAPEGR